VTTFDPVQILRVLVEEGVQLVLIGGVAARVRGAPLLTEDVDVTPATTRENLDRLAVALNRLDARLRTSSEPEGVLFPFDADLLKQSRVWTLTTKYGDLDLVAEPEGTTGYRDLIRDADVITVAVDPPLELRVASLQDIIRSKEAAGRDKDRAALPLLRRTLEEAGS
jgi:hypothetical protein